MDWFTFALLAAVFFASYTLVTRRCLKDHGDAHVFALLANFSTGVLVLALTPFDRVFVNLSGFDMLLVGLASIMLAGSSVLFIWARQLEEVSRVEIMRQSSIVWTFIAAVLLLGESFSAAKTVGVGLVLLGAVIALGERHHWTPTKGLALVLVAAVFVGIISVISRAIVVDNLSPTLFSGTMFILGAVWIFAFLPDSQNRMLAEFKLQRKWIGVIGALSAGNMFFLMKAYQLGEASLVRPVHNTSLMFSVIAGILIMNERDKTGQKLIGAAVAFAGVIVLRLF